MIHIFLQLLLSDTDLITEQLKGLVIGQKDSIKCYSIFLARSKNRIGSKENGIHISQNIKMHKCCKSIIF